MKNFNRMRKLFFRTCGPYKAHTISLIILIIVSGFLEAIGIGMIVPFTNAILNENGNLRAKIFNRENDFRYLGDEFGYTQGMGLSYQVDFNTFKNLINKIKSESLKTK